MPPRRKIFFIFIDAAQGEALSKSLGMFAFWGYTIAIVTAPIWVTFLGLIEVAKILITQAESLGFLLSIHTALSALLLGISSIVFLVIFSRGLIKRKFKLARNSFIIWLLSLLILPWALFLPGISNLLPASPVYKEANKKQSLVAQVEVILLENKYQLNLTPKERKELIELIERDNIRQYIADTIQLERKYNFKTSFKEKVGFIERGSNQAEAAGGQRVQCSQPLFPIMCNFGEQLSEHDNRIRDQIEFQVISHLVEKKVENQITELTPEELAIDFPSTLNRKYFIPRFSRLRTIELTQAWKTKLSDKQRTNLRETYCALIVNSIFWAYRVDAGYMPDKQDPRLLESESINPKTSPDFLDCHKFLISSGYQYVEWRFYKNKG